MHGDPRQFSPQFFQKSRRVKKIVTDPITICCAVGVSYGVLDFKRHRMFYKDRGWFSRDGPHKWRKPFCQQAS